MPRYLVERTFPDGLVIPTDTAGAKQCLAVVDGNAGHGVTWLHSYVSPDRTATYCVYDGPSPEAIRHGGRDQWPAGGQDHRGQGPGSVLLSLSVTTPGGTRSPADLE